MTASGLNETLTQAPKMDRKHPMKVSKYIGADNWDDYLNTFQVTAMYNYYTISLMALRKMPGLCSWKTPERVNPRWWMLYK